MIYSLNYLPDNYVQQQYNQEKLINKKQHTISQNPLITIFIPLQLCIIYQFLHFSTEPNLLPHFSKLFLTGSALLSKVIFLIQVSISIAFDTYFSKDKSFISKPMFDDMFVTEEELLTGQAEGQVQTHWERQPRNCAHGLVMPDVPRSIGYPIGLKNQGATCYLNSLLQILFHTPEFRNMILSLPLCDGTTDKQSNFVGKSKCDFLLGFQRLFSQMSLSDVRAVATDYLNKAFGWEGNQHLQQQDIQQSMRIIFDTIERALFGTQFSEGIRSLFRGKTQRYKSCLQCGQCAEHQEFFYDLQMFVKGADSLQNSLIAFNTPEQMNGGNQIFCEFCQSKQDMLLGSRLHQLPSAIVFTLNRFDFDYEKMDRVKITSKFEFGLEIDLNKFVPNPSNPDRHIYELYGILIHRGSAHGGHYISFIRDVMKESDWQAALEQAKKQEAKIQEGKEKVEKKEQQRPTIKLSQNEDLNNGWFQINDNIVTAIPVEKLANQFEGSESAYILFYRRKGLTVQNRTFIIPQYFQAPIKTANQLLKAQREIYQNEKKHIIINIKGESHKLKTSTPISDFLQSFVPIGHALVQQSVHNGLPYFPMQLIHHGQITYSQKTIQTQQIIHQSQWKIYQLASPEYEIIKNTIGKDRLPFELVLLEGQTPKRIVCYNDQNFLMLRVRIQKQLKIPYEKQVLTLITPYKQAILTDVSQNDNILLPKLGIIHGGQISIKSLGNQQDTQQAKPQTTTLCFLIQRDDIVGLKRIYFQKSKALRDLLTFCVISESLQQGKYRFRNLNGNRLYYLDHYDQKLEEIEFAEEMVKFRLQRGEIPIKGDICVKIKPQSILYKSEEPINLLEKIFDPNTVITDVKDWAAATLGIEVSLHKLYLTDWTGEPIRSLTRQKLTLFEANFGREELLCLRDVHSPIGAELVHLQVFFTPNGSPDSIDQESLHIKIEEFKTVADLKELLIGVIQKLNGLDPSCLRLREIKRDYMFGTIWRDLKKSIRSLTINSTKIVYQVLSKPEELKDDQIVVILKKRNHEKRIYENSTELIFEAGKTPTVEEFEEAVKKRVGVEESVKVIKYVNYDFEWVEISRQNIEKLMKKKKNNQKGQKKGKGKEDPKPKKQGEKQQQIEKKQKPQVTQQNEKQQKKNKPKNKKQNSETPKNVENTKPKAEKNAQKQNKKQNQKTTQDFFNLRKAPILLKDGDLIGWGIASSFVGDDLQTDEDLKLRVINQKTIYRGNDKGGFKINVDF